MNALAIDCAISKLTVAAKKENNIVKVTYDIGIRQSEKLLPAIDFVMKEASLTCSELDYTALTSGPGTFTGLRLGLSALKALTLSHNVPVYGIPSLDCYAWPFRKTSRRILSLIEAKEDEYFYSFYQKGEKLTAESDKTTEDILKEIDAESSVIACGPGRIHFLERTAESFPLYSITSIENENDCTQTLFEIAENMIKENIPPLADYDGPRYVRKSEAEIVLDQKNAASSK